MSNPRETDANRRALGRQLRGSSLLLAGRMLGKLVNFGIQVAIVRLLTKDDFGAFAYGLAIALAGELVVKCGLGRGADRFVPYYAERGERDKVMGTLALVGGTIVGVGCLAYATLAFVSRMGWAGFPQGEGGQVVLILAGLAPIGALDSICIQTLACFSRPRAIFFRKHVLGPGLRALAVALVFFLHGTSVMLALAYLAGGAIGLAICIHLTVQQLRRHGVLPLPLAQWRIPWRPLVRFSFPLLSSDLVYIALTLVTTVVLMMTDGEAGVASMRAVVPAAALNLLVVQSFSILFMPAAMRLHARGDTLSLREHHWQSAAWSGVLSFPIFALTFGVAPGLVPLLFGDVYAESASLLAMLAFGHYVGVCAGFNGQTLMVLERTRAIVASDFVTIAIAIGLAAGLCPHYGALGAAVSVTGARIAGTLGRQIVLLRTPGFETVPAQQKRVWLKLLIATAVISGSGWLWQPPLLGQLALAGAVSLALLRSTAHSLDIARSFPELMRVPLFAKMVGA